MDFKKIIAELRIDAQKLPPPTIPKLPSTKIPGKLPAPTPYKPTPLYEKNLLERGKVTFTPEGTPILSKEFFTPEGKLKNPALAREALYNAKKQKILQEIADNKFLENSSKEIAKLNASVSRSIAIENFSNVAKKGLYIFGGLVSLMFLFSGLKPKSNSVEKQKVIDSIEKPSIDINKLKSDLSNFKDSTNDDQLKKDCDMLLKCISALSTVTNIDDIKSSQNYSKYIRFFKSKAIDVSLKADSNLKNELTKYILFIDGVGK